MRNKGNLVLTKTIFGLLMCVLVASSAIAAVSDSEFIALCGNGSLQQVNTAIKDGANVNARDDNGITPLMSAIWSNPNIGVIAALISDGADVNAENNVGVTPLMYAEYKKSRPDVVTLLLKNGAASGGVIRYDGLTTAEILENLRKEVAASK